MGNLLTYLWETMGDQWEQRAWNAVDSLILSQFAYLPLEEVCTEAFDFSKGMPLGEAAAVMLALPDIKEKILTRRDLLLLRMLSESERFRNLRVCGCRKRHQTAEPEQFAAYCVELTQEPPCWFAAFRGTDRTLTGWEEDLQLSYLETTPTQEDAVQYLEQAAAALPGTFLVGGHSKGGNAAVYAAVFCSVSVQNRIQVVYNHDGPGFQPSVLASPPLCQCCRSDSDNCTARIFCRTAFNAFGTMYDCKKQCSWCDAACCLQLGSEGWRICNGVRAVQFQCVGKSDYGILVGTAVCAAARSIDQTAVCHSGSSWYGRCVDGSNSSKGTSKYLPAMEIAAAGRTGTLAGRMDAFV